MHSATTGPETGGGPGYRAPHVCKLVGITYRQLDYWARTGLIEPSLQRAEGSGTQRLYSFTDLLQLRVIERLLGAGISLSKIRKAVEWLREMMQTDHPLMDITLVSDGTSIWGRDQADEASQLLMDLLERGQGVFGIAIGQVQRDLEGEILELFPPETPYVEGEAEAAAN